MSARQPEFVAGPEGDIDVVTPADMARIIALLVDEGAAAFLVRGVAVDPRVARLLSKLRQAAAAHDRGQRANVRQRTPDLLGTDHLGVGGNHLTVAATASALGVTDRHVRRLASDDEFPGARRHGREWAIPLEDIEAYRQRRTAA